MQSTHCKFADRLVLDILVYFKSRHLFKVILKGILKFLVWNTDIFVFNLLLNRNASFFSGFYTLLSNMISNCCLYVLQVNLGMPTKRASDLSPGSLASSKFLSFTNSDCFHRFPAGL